MKDIISFDVKLTQNQKLAQEKLDEVHQLYDEIEKLLGTQDVFKRPHLFMTLPKKEPQTNEEWLRSCTKEQLAEFIVKAMILYDNSEMTAVEAIKNAVKNDVKLSNYFMEGLLEWLKKPHTPKE